MNSVKTYANANWLGILGVVFLVATVILFAVGASGRARNTALVAAAIFVLYRLDKIRPRR